MSSIGDEDIDDTASNADPRINGLLGGYHWSFYARENFSYSIPMSPEPYYDTRELLIDDYPDDNADYVFAMPPAIVTAIARSAREFEKILTFPFTIEPGHEGNTKVRYGIAGFFADGHDGAPAYAHPPDAENGFLGVDRSNWMSGDIFLRDADYAEALAGVGSAEYMNILHETGHAMGLKHGHEPVEYDGLTRPALPEDVDTLEFSVMTYRSYRGASVDGGGYSNPQGHYPQSLMMLDIAALQSIYGADYTTQQSDTLYAWDPDTGAYSINGVTEWSPAANVVFMTVWDGGGTDTYDFSAYSTNITASLNPGGWIDTNGPQNAQLDVINGAATQLARGNVFNALLYDDNQRSLIENLLTGTGNDLITGNNADNMIDASGGDDTIWGGRGDDTLIGGRGRDELYGGGGHDLAGYTAAGGVNVTINALGYAPKGKWRVDGLAEGKGDYLEGIEGFKFGKGNDVVRVASDTSVDLYGGAGDDTLIGGDGPDFLVGEAGSDVFRPGAGVFTVFGGTQRTNGTWDESQKENDLLVIDRSDVRIAFTMSRYDLTGSEPLGVFEATGGSTARGITQISFFGGRGTEVVDGGIGNDDISGGAGQDLFRTGRGNDFASGGAGEDTIYLGGGKDMAFGDNGNDYISGDGGADTLWGGQGQDYLRGGAGNDEIHSGRGGDVALFGEAGQDLIFGDVDNEVLYGGTGDDTLDGGAGDDTLSGDAGADRFILTPESGQDVIDDFDSRAKGGQDILDVHDFNYRGFGAMLAAGVEIRSYRGGTLIDFGDGAAQVELYEVKPGTIDAGDFSF